MTKRQHGVVVTHIEHLDQLAECLSRGEYDTVKVVTKFGIDGGWNAENRSRLLRMVPHVIVRTAYGDPSFNNHDFDFRFPFDNQVKDELQEWYDIRQDILFEIGNEPNIDTPDDDFIAAYLFHLNRAIDRCRDKFPEAKLISPALITDLNKRFERFHELAANTFRRCDLIGLHFYEHFGFAKGQQPATTFQLRDVLRLAQRFYGDKEWYVTEYGINDENQVSKGEKGRRYAGLTFFGESDPALPNNVVGLTYYHLNMNSKSDRQYHIFPEGDQMFGSRVRATPPRGLAPTTSSAPPPQPFLVIDPCSANPADNFASVRQAPTLKSPEAGRLQPGTPVLIDVIKDEWAHLARTNPFLDLGFVPVSLLRQAS
jgi:hypothetical protein